MRNRYERSVRHSKPRVLRHSSWRNMPISIGYGSPIACSVSAQLIFHASMRRHVKDAQTTLAPTARQQRCLSSYVLWAVILTELRFALFVSCGRAVLLFWSTNESPENGTIEFLQLKNCGRWVSTGVCYGRAMTFSRGWILDSRLETIEISRAKQSMGRRVRRPATSLKRDRFAFANMSETRAVIFLRSSV